MSTVLEAGAALTALEADGCAAIFGGFTFGGGDALATTTAIAGSGGGNSRGASEAIGGGSTGG